MVKLLIGLALAASANAFAAPTKEVMNDYLVKFTPGVLQNMQLFSGLAAKGAQIEPLIDTWIRIQAPANKISKEQFEALATDPSIEYVQPNYTIRLLEDFRIQDPLRRAAYTMTLKRNPEMAAAAPRQDNPAIPDAPAQKNGTDPDLNKQWGMKDIGAAEGWKVTRGNPEMIVAVLDTGVDYTHEDLLPNMWRNPREIPNNGVDDDNNGYVDDIVGWDFVANDNKPYDLAVSWQELLVGGGNPGHGTHCAGNVAARGGNSLGISGVAPNVKIMALRFISEKGAGTTADAIKAIRYAIDNGAKITSNSWGSEGEDPSEGAENKALRDVIQYSQDHGSLFIAAAGNGHSGVGYDNDTDKNPGVPASYNHDIIVSVAALDVRDQLGSFSNWGLKTVDIGAPGVDVYSTTVGNKYNNKVIDVGGLEVTWDGTSMATPHVAGAAALYWSAHPEKSWQDVKAAILGSAKKINSLNNKAVSGGKLDVKALMSY
ncbi:MAG: hypothetical protein BroJett040_16550 [Oligoflexia bacterium]|nr:MAG: hypothetical protein BroJett040_16550 [Oligoflexia bacterium]